MIRYPCLVLDHDDTVVHSTATVHQPCFQAFLDRYRPGQALALTEYFTENFDGTFADLCHRRYHLSDAEMAEELAFWNDWVARHIPPAYDGLRDLLHRYRAEGGLICVVSHSLSWNIRRDYAANGLPEPDRIFGWDDPPEQRKPSPYPLRTIMADYGLTPGELLMVDDLKPGYDMAWACGVDFAAAGWSNDIPRIREFMGRHCRYYLEQVSDLEKLLFA